MSEELPGDAGRQLAGFAPGSLVAGYRLEERNAAGRPRPRRAPAPGFSARRACPAADRSPYVAFAPVENQTVTRAQLQAPTPAEQALWDRYDPGNNYPFIDIGNRYVIKDALYSPAVLAGMTWAGVAAALRDPSSSVAQGVDGAANVITAAICAINGNQPSAVCSSSTIRGLEARL